MFDFIIVHGAPGSGKTTIAHLLRERLGSPFIDFGTLRDFHLHGDWTQQTDEDEQMAFENLVFILENYARHGYRNVIVNDLRDARIVQIPTVFKDYRYIIFSLIVEIDDELKKRVLTASREGSYRNFAQAIELNRRYQKRAVVSGEHRIDNTHTNPEATVQQILSLLE